MDLKECVDNFMEEMVQKDINIDLLFEHVRDSILMEDDGPDIAEIFAKALFKNAFTYTALGKDAKIDDINRRIKDLECSHLNLQAGREYEELVNKSLSSIGKTVSQLESEFPGIANDIAQVGLCGKSKDSTQVLRKAIEVVGEIDPPPYINGKAGDVMLDADSLTDKIYLNHSMDI